jgi:hypothetical protein
MLHVISLAQFGMAYTCGWAANSINSRIRLKAKCERLEQKVARLTEEIRIKDARMSRLDARKRPHYPASERMAILLLRAACGWSLKQTARRFLVTPATISSQAANFPGSSEVLGPHDPEARCQAKVHRHRQGASILVRWIQGLVQRQKDQAPLRRRWQVRKHCCG